MIEKITDIIAVKLALAFVVLELTYINSKSLLFLAESNNSIDYIFSISGAAAFSMVTVIVMRKSTSKMLKLVFPIFDIALMFCGLNIEYANTLDQIIVNPIRFSLTIFLSLFTGLITYSLVAINKETDSTTTQLNDSKSNQIESKSFDSELAPIKSILLDGIKHRAWLARKKNESVRNASDIAACEISDRMKKGETVSLNECINQFSNEK